MKLESISIKNFRCFDDVRIQIDDYTALIGPNGCGKSAVLSALNVFFAEKTSAIPSPHLLGSDVFHHHNHAAPIEIKLQFGSLTEEEQSALSNYVRAGKLIVSAEAEFDAGKQCATVKQYGYRLGIERFAPFFELLSNNSRIDALTAVFDPLAQEFGLAIQGRQTKAAMEGALREYEELHPELHAELKSEDQFYGFRGTNKLKPFLQYIYLPAVKDAADEELEARSGVLGSLVSRIVRSELNLDAALGEIQLQAIGQLRTLFDGNKTQLDKLSTRLTSLAQNLFPELKSVQMKWNQELESQVKIDSPLVRVDIDDRNFSGPVSKFGHGIQRSYILALLQLFAESATDNTSAKILFACEEPELYQHPPQARHLAEALLQVSRKHGQVLVTSHSPYFISGENFSALRLLKATDRKVAVKSATFNDISVLIAEAKNERPHAQSAIHAGLVQKLQPPLNEIFFARFAVLVEGVEDVAFLRTQFDIRDKWTRLLSLGGHIVPALGKEAMVSPAAICTALDHPFFCVLDADGQLFGSEPYSRAIAHFAQVDLSTIRKDTNHFDKRAVVWGSKIGPAVSSDFGDDWSRVSSEVCRVIGASEGRASKNPLLINLTLNNLAAANKFSKNLDEAIDRILAFGERLR